MLEVELLSSSWEAARLGAGHAEVTSNAFSNACRSSGTPCMPPSCQSRQAHFARARVLTCNLHVLCKQLPTKNCTGVSL